MGGSGGSVELLKVRRKCNFYNTFSCEERIFKLQ